MTDTLTAPSLPPQGRFNTWLFNIFNNTNRSVTNMTETEIAVEEDLLVDLTFHGFSAGLLKEFALKIVKPYFNGNMNKAIKSLIEKAIMEETLVNQALLLESKG